MKSVSHSIYPFLIIVLALSFWSSGIMLIRFLGTFNTWSLGPQLYFVYGLSVPIIFVSIRGVQNLFVRLYKEKCPAAIYQITGIVLMMHALLISLVPALYSFTPTTGLYATAWLLWFGGVTILLQSFTQKNTKAYVQQ